MSVVLGLLSACNNKLQSDKKVKYIAYIGRYTDPKGNKPPEQVKKFDMMHELTLRKYLSETELPYTKLELKTFDCRRDPAVSDSIYKAIAGDSSIVAIIDNTWGEHLKGASETIRKNQLPVIAINADRNLLDFGNTIFTGNNDHLPHDLLSFVSKVKKTKEINFITEKDYPVHELFVKSFSEYGINVRNTIEVEGKGFDAKDSVVLYDQLNKVFSDVSNQRRLTIINVHSSIGNHLIDYLDTKFSELQLLGHSYIVNAEHIKHFGAKNNNNLIIVSTPTDAISKRMTLDIEKLKANSPEYFQNPNHPMFVKRCLDAVELIKNKFEYQPDTTTLSKRDFSTFFNSLRNQVISEEDEIYEFDSLLTVLPELYFVEYSAGKLHSYPLQLNLDREVIPNLFFGMEIVDIYNIDVNSNSFTSDFYYWVKLDSANKDAEKFIIFQNMKQNESSRELIFEKLDGRTIYKLYKVSGVFYVNYQLGEYPFDQQEIFIRAEILNPASKLKVSFDQKSFQLDAKAIEKFKINEWDKLKYYVTVENEVARGMHGDPDIDEEKLSEFKNINFRLVVKRKVVSPLLEIVLPLMLIGLVSIALFLVHDVSFENLGEVSIGVFITIVAFSISYSSSTPTTDHLTRADILFWLTFSVVLLNFLIVIIVNSIYPPEEAKKIDLRRVGIFMVIAYIAMVCWALLA
jgi:hypothetical protein